MHFGTTYLNESLLPFSVTSTCFFHTLPPSSALLKNCLTFWYSYFFMQLSAEIILTFAGTKTGWSVKAQCRLYQRLDSWWMHIVDYNKDFDVKNILSRTPSQTLRLAEPSLFYLKYRHSAILFNESLVALYIGRIGLGDIIGKCFNFSG